MVGPAVEGTDSQPILKEFIYVETDEPHASRRLEILKAHPEIKELYGPCPYLKYTATASVISQLALASYYANHAWGLDFWLVVYFIGGTTNHSLLLAIHDITHNLAFKNYIANRVFSIFANLPIGIPYAIAFKGYHMEHHRFQGTDGYDTDLPTYLEAELFNSTIGKFFFCFFQIFFYALRPMFIRPQKITSWHLINWAVQIAFAVFFIKVVGVYGYLYLLICTFVGGSLHPMSGHFIAEHYVKQLGYETYSYYGPMNYFAYNVGYHNEHHDFPYIAGSRLPLVRKIAPEFYENLPVVESWPGAIYDYITKPYMNPYRRARRHPKGKEGKGVNDDEWNKSTKTE